MFRYLHGCAAFATGHGRALTYQARPHYSHPRVGDLHNRTAGFKALPTSADRVRLDTGQLFAGGTYRVSTSRSANYHRGNRPLRGRPAFCR